MADKAPPKMPIPPLAFVQSGLADGRPLVLVHGWCCHRVHMEPLARKLDGSYCLFCIDLPGHGETPVGPSFEFSSLADSLAQFLEAHDLSDAVLAGHSMGGVLSLMASVRSERVSAVINIDGAFPLTSAACLAYGELFSQIRPDKYAEMMEPFLRRAFFLPEEQGPVADAILRDMLSAPVEQALALLRQFPGLDAEATLSQLSVPTLYLGAKTPRFDEAAVRDRQSQIRMARIDHCGHFLPIFAPVETAALIRGFLG